MAVGVEIVKGFRWSLCMRIAISGTHCCGKSTLIDEFLLTHPDFAHEPEAYELLQEEYGERFAAEPCAEDFYRQLEFNADRLRQYKSGFRVIFERSPADYLAYMIGLAELRRDSDATRVLEGSLEIAREAISHLDLILFLRATGEVDVSEDPKLRRVVNNRLEGVLIDNELDLYTANHPTVVEASGTTTQRLRTLENILNLESLSQNSATDFS